MASCQTASPEQRNIVELLVDRIFAAKQWNAEAGVSALKWEINQLMYALYGLAPDKIKLIEETR